MTGIQTLDNLFSIKEVDSQQIWDKDFAAAVATAGLEELLVHFLLYQRTWNRYQRTWKMVRQGREVRSCKDYSIGLCCCIFHNMAVCDRWNNSDHDMVQGCLCDAYLREH